MEFVLFVLLTNVGMSIMEWEEELVVFNWKLLNKIKKIKFLHMKMTGHRAIANTGPVDVEMLSSADMDMAADDVVAALGG